MDLMSMKNKCLKGKVGIKMKSCYKCSNSKICSIIKSVHKTITEIPNEIVLKVFNTTYTDIALNCELYNDINKRYINENKIVCDNKNCVYNSIIEGCILETVKIKRNGICFSIKHFKEIPK